MTSRGLVGYWVLQISSFLEHIVFQEFCVYMGWCKYSQSRFRLFTKIEMISVLCIFTRGLFNRRATVKKGWRKVASIAVVDMPQPRHNHCMSALCIPSAFSLLSSDDYDDSSATPIGIYASVHCNQFCSCASTSTHRIVPHCIKLLSYSSSSSFSSSWFWSGLQDQLAVPGKPQAKTSYQLRKPQNWRERLSSSSTQKNPALSLYISIQIHPFSLKTKTIWRVMVMRWHKNEWKQAH